MTCDLQTHGRLHPHLEQEWMLTNGIGGFAAASVVGCNTRRYHGLLVAATLPPLGRVMALNRIGEALYIDRDRRLEFSVNQFGQTLFPRGDAYLRRFTLDQRTARWEYDIEGVIVVKTVTMLRGRNLVLVRYAVDPGPARRVELHLAPLLSIRDFHALRRKSEHPFEIGVEPDRLTIAAEDDLTLRLTADAGEFAPAPDWWLAHTYPRETERGLDDTEDLFTPGHYRFETGEPAAITLAAAVNEDIQIADLKSEISNLKSEISNSRSHISDLTRAADAFIVPRRRPDGRRGTTILAGYPWFADWGRDTMISLPGLLLSTHRFEEARQVLTLYAEYVSEGMIPNRFDDYTNEPHYNTVDASLWFIHAAHEYQRLSGDRETFDQVLLSACREIIRGYRQGTRFHIRMESDALITAGDPHTQLTWMDAKHGDTAFTPRHGKAVEINALWHHALVLMDEPLLAEQCAESFRAQFWISPWRGLCDVVTGGHRDTSLRPNQVFAVSLPHSPLTRDQQHAVVETVRRELLTPFGLRTLARGEPNYHGRCAGSPFERDRAYHNGTVWPWLLGHFLEAWLRVNDHSEPARHQARQWLTPLFQHLRRDGCIGQISEIFDGDEPYRPGGCFAQAWSVAETLRLAKMLEM